MFSTSSIRSLFAGALVAAASLSLVPAADAVNPGRNGRLAFTSGREAANDNEARLYLRGSIGLPGQLSAPITPLGGQSRHPSWSPDRTKLVYANGTFTGNPATEEYDLFVLDLVAGSIRALDGLELGDGLSSDHPTWSPDGTKIAYEAQTVDNSANREIKVKTVGTADRAVALTNTAQMELKPAWSPDSRTLYYARQNGTQQASNYDIYKEPLTGSNGPSAIATSSQLDEYQPAVSADGSKLCFTRQSTPGNTATAEIYTLDLPSAANPVNVSDDAAKGDINCVWSPDSRKIAFTNGVFGQGRLVVVNSDDSSAFPTQLADDQGSNNFDGNADWASDGSPDCPDFSVTTRPGTPITVPLECTDTGPAYERTDPNGTVSDPPANGTTSDDSPLTNPSTVRYTPKAGFTGTDTLRYTAFDDYGFGTDKGTVTIRVQAPAGNGGGGNGGGGGNAGGGKPKPRCAGLTATVVGTRGNDTLIGTKRRDVIVAGRGNDAIRGAGGNDVICAGPGRDRVRGGTGNDRLAGGDGNDRITGESGADRVSGESGNDVLSGGDGNDQVAGGAGNDRISGGRGNDRVTGGSGRDRVAGDSGRDRLAGDSGRDRCHGGLGRDRAARCEVKALVP